MTRLQKKRQPERAAADQIDQRLFGARRPADRHGANVWQPRGFGDGDPRERRATRAALDHEQDQHEDGEHEAGRGRVGSHDGARARRQMQPFADWEDGRHHLRHRRVRLLLCLYFLSCE